MTIYETKIDHNDNEVSKRRVKIGEIIDLGEILGGTIFAKFSRLGTSINTQIPKVRWYLRVLRHKSRQDRLLLMPFGTEFVGRQINLANFRIPSTEEGVKEVKITSTRNNVQKRRYRRSH